MRSSSYMRSRWRRLLPGHTAAKASNFQAGVLSGFHRAAHGLAYERRHFDSALLDV
jgi:hypothetical protein